MEKVMNGKMSDAPLSPVRNEAVSMARSGDAYTMKGAETPKYEAVRQQLNDHINAMRVERGLMALDGDTSSPQYIKMDNAIKGLESEVAANNKLGADVAAGRSAVEGQRAMDKVMNGKMS